MNGEKSGQGNENPSSVSDMGSLSKNSHPPKVSATKDLLPKSPKRRSKRSADLPDKNESTTPPMNTSTVKSDQKSVNPNESTQSFEHVQTTPAELTTAFKTNKTKKTTTSSAKKSATKRKRSLFLETLDPHNKSLRISEFQQQISSLFSYFNETFDIGTAEMAVDSFHNSSESGIIPTNTIIARLLEESRLSLTKLVDEIHEKLKCKANKLGGMDIGPALIKSSVLLIAQRPCYGISKDNVADQLEDDTESCLWCWEVNDLKLLPKSERDVISIRRKCRKKIHERIVALSAMISALSSESEECTTNLSPVEEMLTKTDDEISIRSLVADSLQKYKAQMIAKQAKMKEKEAVKEKEKNDRLSELEHKRLERELKKEKILQEKEQIRLQKEALMQEKERKRQQDEAQREQRKHEKEEAEKKKQIALKKQATLMDRFLQSKKEVSAQNALPTVNENASNCSQNNVQISGQVIASMDQILLSSAEEMGDLLRLHLEAWRLSNRSTHKPQLHWGVRQRPKIAVVSELRLQGAPVGTGDKIESDTAMKKISTDLCSHGFPTKDAENDWDKILCYNLSENNGGLATLKDILRNRRKKLLQFDKSNRPGYYGTYSKKSTVIGPRHPFAKDASLDYEVDSDEEWEEEDPGESLSDCDEDDDEEEKLELEKNKIDEDDDSDGFFVPDGYLSEDEGVCLNDTVVSEGQDSFEELPSFSMSDNGNNNNHRQTEAEWHKFQSHQKVLAKITESALTKNHVFVISNLQKEREKFDQDQQFGAPELNTREKMEQLCLQALCIQICCPEILIDALSTCPAETNVAEGHEPPPKRQKRSVAGIPDSYMPELISTIQSSGQGIKKILDSLPEKFSCIPRSELKSKIRETADFKDNIWQIKAEVLEKYNIIQVEDTTAKVCLPTKERKTPRISSGPIKEAMTPKICIPVKETNTPSMTSTPPAKVATPQAKSSVSKPKGISSYFSKRCLPPDADSEVKLQNSSDNNNEIEKERKVSTEGRDINKMQ